MQKVAGSTHAWTHMCIHMQRTALHHPIQLHCRRCTMGTSLSHGVTAWCQVCEQGVKGGRSARHTSAGKAACMHAEPGFADQRHAAATEHQEDADHLENGKPPLLTVLLPVSEELERQWPLQLCRGCKPSVTRTWLVPPQGDGSRRRFVCPGDPAVVGVCPRPPQDFLTQLALVCARKPLSV